MDCLNEFINIICSSEKNNWFAKFIINTDNSVSKTGRNM